MIWCSRRLIVQPYPEGQESLNYLGVVPGGQVGIAAIAAATPREIILLASVLLTIRTVGGVHPLRSHRERPRQVVIGRPRPRETRGILRPRRSGPQRQGAIHRERQVAEARLLHSFHRSFDARLHHLTPIALHHAHHPPQIPQTNLSTPLISRLD